MKRFAPLSSHVMVFSLFMVFAIWLTPASANTPPVFSSLGQLRATGMGVPGAMDLDAAGNLYVADAMSRKVYRFDPYGNLKRVYEIQASGRGLAVTPDGTRLYVARHVTKGTGTLKEQIGSAVIVDTATGTIIGELTGSGDAPEFKLTGEIDLDADGNVFVADAGSGRLMIKIYSPNGQFRSQFGGVGNVVGKFQSISALTINGAGQVVVADPSPAALGGRIQVFTVDPVNFTVTNTLGYLKSTAANFGSVELHTPKGIAFDHLGRGYFLEYYFSTITVLNNSFAYLSKYNNVGFEPGQLAYVADAIYDVANKRLFVSCDGGRIEVLATEKVCGTAGADPANCSQSPVHANEPPSVPLPQTPVGGSVEATDVPVLTFAAATDEDATLTYQVVVKQGDAIVYTHPPTTATSVTVPAGLLAENGSFTWAVQAVDSEGEVSGFSPAAAFVVNAVDEAPTAPELQPLVTEGILAKDWQFNWSASSDPDPNDLVSGYRVDIATNGEFAADDMVLSAQLTATAVALGDFANYAKLEIGTTYFCRVTAMDLDGTAASGEAVSFVYDTTVLNVDAGLRGSAVYLGGNLAYPGRPVGTTPLELRDLAPGRYVVTVEAAGFEPNLTQVDVVDLGTQSVYASLKPAQQPQTFVAAKSINGRLGLQVNAAAAPFVIDFDGDGQMDLLAGDAAGKITLFKSILISRNGDMTVGLGELLLETFSGAVPFVADWNNDDRQDLLVGLADGTVALYLNQGVNQFAASQLLQAAGTPLTVAAGAAPVVVDLDRDGRKDLVVGNALGQLFVCWNAGADDAPQLGAPVLLLEQPGIAVVPTAIDWNADGQRDLLVASASGVNVYLNDLAASGPFVLAPLPAIPAKAVFAVDVDGDKGEDLIVGAADGRLLFAAASSAIYPPAYPTALLGKTVELQDLLIGMPSASELLGRVEVIRSQIVDGSYAGAAVSALRLAALLPVGDARQSAAELVALCGGDPSSLGTSRVDLGATTETVPTRVAPTTRTSETSTLPVSEPVAPPESTTTVPQRVAPTGTIRTR